MTSPNLFGLERNRGRSAAERKARKPYKASVYTADGVAEGGTCIGCGKNLGYSYIYKLCDECVTIPPDSVYKSVGAASGQRGNW